MYQYTLDPEEELKLSRPSSEEISQTAAKQVAPTADNTDFLQQAMKVLGDKRAQAQPIERRVPGAPQRPDVQGDDWRMLLAMGLDILGNKGRNLGQIAMAGTQSRNQRIDQFNAQNSPEAQLKREMQVAQLQQMDRASQTAEVQEATALAGQLRADFNAKEGVREFDTKLQQSESQHNDDMLYKGLDVQDRRAKMEQDGSLAQARMQQDELQDKRRIGLGYGQLNLNKAQLAEQQRYHDAQLQDSAADRAARLQAEQLKAGVGEYAVDYVPEGIKATSPAFARTLAKGGAESTKMLERIELNRKYQSNLKMLEEIRSRPPSDANRKLYDQTVSKFIAGLADQANTGTLDRNEYDRYKVTFPSYTSANPEASMRRKISQGTESISGFKEAILDGKDTAAEQFHLMRQQAQKEYGSMQKLYGFQDSYNPWGDEEADDILSGPGLELESQ